MPLTYTYSGPSSGDKDHVRFLIGDYFDPWYLADEEITHVLSQEANVYMAAAACCTRILAMIARRPNKSVGGMTVNYESVTRQYRDIQKDLQKRGLAHQTVEAGGISLSDKTVLDQDTDWPQPDFKRGQFDRDDVSRNSDYVNEELV